MDGGRGSAGGGDPGRPGQPQDADHVASFFTSTGYPAYTPPGLASAVTNGPLTALAGGGVYVYGSSNAFPANVYNDNNYWVDVVYSTSP
jgi:hypothetical protein